jgi:short subunit dehydrogenase-like uncharacterized protein
MAARIVVFGATGYTGRLTAEALHRQGQRPVLAGRSPAQLDQLAGELGGDLDVAVADVARPESVRGLVGKGDVLVSTVGPFVRWGEAAVQAALRKGAHYLDSNGEPPFTRRVFERHGPAAAPGGIAMLTAFGWESVPGNLAGALALHEAGEAAVRVDTGYFHTAFTGFSGGTRASFAGAMALPSFAFRDGAIRTVRGADRYRTMPVRGRKRPGVALGASEHFALPRTFPHVREVNAYLGWLGPLSRPVNALSRVGFAAFRVPGVRALYEAVTSRYVKGSTGGPGADERARGGTHVVGLAYDALGMQLAEVHLSGVDGYEFTGAILAWGAERVAAGAVTGTGALGPVEAFGIDELEAGCGRAGIARASRGGRNARSSTHEHARHDG